MLNETRQESAISNRKLNKTMINSYLLISFKRISLLRKDKYQLSTCCIIQALKLLPIVCDRTVFPWGVEIFPFPTFMIIRSTSDKVVVSIPASCWCTKYNSPKYLNFRFFLFSKTNTRIMLSCCSYFWNIYWYLP